MSIESEEPLLNTINGLKKENALLRAANETLIQKEREMRVEANRLRGFLEQVAISSKQSLYGQPTPKPAG